MRRQESRALRGVAMQLENWVDPRHLEAAAQAAYAAAFALVPFTSVVIDNFLRPDKFAALQRVFRIEGTFRQRHYLWEWDAGGRSERAVTPEVWHAASGSVKAFVEGVFDGPDPDYRIGEGIVTHYKFVSLLGSAEFMSFLREVTGVKPATLTGLLARTMSGGQYIPPHSDFMPTRDLCGVFYASEGWQPAFGGRFRHCGPASNPIPIEPRPNRLLLFQPRHDCRHDVESVTAAGANWQRWSYSIWFGTPSSIERDGRLSAD